MSRPIVPAGRNVADLEERIAELEAREVGYIQSLRELEAENTAYLRAYEKMAKENQRLLEANDYWHRAVTEALEYKYLPQVQARLIAALPKAGQDLAALLEGE